MGGLGQRGQEKARVLASELFRRTETEEPEAPREAENSKAAFTQKSKNTSVHAESTQAQQPPVRKQFVLSWELSEKLREYCFRERRKEVDVVREALAEYFERHDG